MESTEPQTTLEATIDILFTSDSWWTLIAANRWNGTDLHVADGRTLRFTREDPEGDYWIGVISRNGVVFKHATVSSNIDSDALAAIATALWS